ncbi:interferon-induced GTP-binding Mx3-like protein [Labeo rohita]|uniref:Interferon-induced GTP-binding Mx3-like protein n=1 Tax=Labeo rohita TaxID=84645 RepID=A0A498MF12_LABRO|nr:interferon-induced GTP-binding Mx3-like protein [Labeo rohita]
MKGEVHSHLEESIRPYIDLIDTLRSIGIHKDLSLPTVVVIGDQSSGKSSVLEALSGIALPRGSGIVTRCPLELRLKKVTGGVKWKAVLSYRKKRIELVDSSIFASPLNVSGQLRSGKVAHSVYDEKKFEFEDPSEVEERVKAAQNELAGKGVGIRNELITLEIMSPDVCDLTLIDLPGIARVPVKGQPQDIGDQIKNLIMTFIKKEETINMVVVPCNTDITTTEALKMAQEVDPEGKRTIAILTKPDLIDKGTEKNILAVVHNKVIPLRKGYIMVKCRGQQQINDEIPLEEAEQMEKDFFQNHDYYRGLLTENRATIKGLAVRLTHILVDHIKKSLPQLDDNVKKMLWDAKNELNECEEGPPQDPKGAKQFLIMILKKFNDRINSLSTGDLIIKENLFVRLREIFKKWNDHLVDTKPSFKNMKEFCQNNRGRELLGFSNYRVFEIVLQSQVATLKKPAFDLLNIIKEIILEQFRDVSNQSFQNYPVLLDITTKKIINIQASQHAKAQERISEQFEMENMIYTQDPIYLKMLNEISHETFSEDQLPIFDTKTKYSEMLQAYYDIVVQRMADQLPMMITLFMLKQTAQFLSTDMLSLLDWANVSELLFDNSDNAKKRKDLQKMKGEVHSHLEKSIRPYIDLIDTLRTVGIHKDLGLPTIAVIGDQSSGKSSVLEALSGVALPRGSGIVTRCPLELRLKKVTGVNWKAVLTYNKKTNKSVKSAGIKPSKLAGETTYNEEKIEFADPSLVEKHVAAAQNELAGKGVGISDELITLEIMSPDVCDLTLIDLPGIARVPVEGQPEDIGKQIKRLIKKYIIKHETVNLVVVPCNIDIATTEALQMAQEVDPDGIRTIAILTKPDLIDKGTEKSILSIVHNQVIPLRKGYIMVKCRGQQQINDEIPLEEAAQIERDFFQNHDYFRCILEDNKATIKCLAVRLTQDLVDHIKAINNTNELSQKNRGRELPGFSNYRLFEKILQDHVAELKEPAIDLLNAIKDIIIKEFTDVVNKCFQNYHVLQNTVKDKLNHIQLTQLEKAEQRISEQFKMENRIYTQDPIFLKILTEITNETFSTKELPVFDKVCSYRHMLEAYYEIVVQRMADQLPLMINFYMLQETAQLLSIDIMKLLEKPDVHELLSENSDVSRRRKELRARLNRLTAAAEAITNFFND